MRYRLRTLMVALAIAPPVLAYVWFNPPPHPAGVLAVVVLYVVTFLAVTAGIESIAGCLMPDSNQDTSRPE